MAALVEWDVFDRFVRLVTPCVGGTAPEWPVIASEDRTGSADAAAEAE